MKESQACSKGELLCLLMIIILNFNFHCVICFSLVATMLFLFSRLSVSMLRELTFTSVRMGLYEPIRNFLVSEKDKGIRPTWELFFQLTD